MQEKGIISTNQFVWMLFSIITSFTTLQVPGMLISHAGRDAWLSVAGAWFLDVLLAIVYAYMGLRFPGQNFVQYSMTIYGKYIGRIIGAMFPLYFLLVASLLMRSLSALISNLFLPRTPMEVTLAISYALIAYGVKKGIEAIARTCEVLGPIYLLSLVTLLAFVMPEVKIHRLKPMFTDGIYPCLTGAPFILSFIGICIMMGMYIPICNRPQNGFLAKFISVCIGAAMTGLLVCFSAGIFGAEQAGSMINPGFELTRLIHIGYFFERMEIIWLLVALAAGIMTSVSLVWAFCVGTSQIMGLDTYKPLVYPAALLAFVLSMTSFENTAALLDFTFYSYMFIALFVQTGLEMLLFVTALVSGKRGAKA